MHSGYGIPVSNTIANDIKLIPDEGTKKLFAGFNIVYRLINDSLICFMRSELFAPPATDLKVPFIPFLGDVRIRFLMYTTRNFMDRTEVVATGKKQVYLFSNRINNVVDSDRFISREIDTHVASNDYDAGAIVEQGGQLFVALQPLLGSANIPITDVGFWREINPVEQLVNHADLEDPLFLELEETCFAVIDIYNNGTTNNGYALFVTGPDNQLRSPVYSLRFKSKI
jgi:hypothetical protein